MVEWLIMVNGFLYYDPEAKPVREWSLDFAQDVHSSRFGTIL
jgi:hypothetical protein